MSIKQFIVNHLSFKDSVDTQASKSSHNSQVSEKDDFSSMIKELKSYSKDTKNSKNANNVTDSEAQKQQLIAMLAAMQNKSDMFAQFQNDGNQRRKRSNLIDSDIYSFNRMDVFSDKYDLKMNIHSLDKKDIEFFKDFSQNPEMQLQFMNPQNQQANFALPDPTAGQISYKSIDFSKGFYELIDKAYATQKPVRLDFDNSSVILKISNTGLLSAQFVSRDVMMEQMIKANIQSLRDKLDSEGIPYKNISYKDNNDKQQKKDNGGPA